MDPNSPRVTAPSCHRVGGHRPCISAPEGRGHLARRDERRKCGPRRLRASALVGTASPFRAEKKVCATSPATVEVCPS